MWGNVERPWRALCELKKPFKGPEPRAGSCWKEWKQKISSRMRIHWFGLQVYRGTPDDTQHRRGRHPSSADQGRHQQRNGGSGGGRNGGRNGASITAAAGTNARPEDSDDLELCALGIATPMHVAQSETEVKAVSKITSFQTQKLPKTKIYTTSDYHFLERCFVPFNLVWSILLRELSNLWKTVIRNIKNFWKQITTCGGRGAWNTVPENSVGHCVNFYLWSLKCLERCDNFYWN